MKDENTQQSHTAHLITVDQPASISLLMTLTNNVTIIGQVSYAVNANQVLALHLVVPNACHVQTFTFYWLFHLPWLELL